MITSATLPLLKKNSSLGASGSSVIISALHIQNKSHRNFGESRNEVIAFTWFNMWWACGDPWSPICCSWIDLSYKDSIYWGIILQIHLVLSVTFTDLLFQFTEIVFIQIIYCCDQLGLDCWLSSPYSPQYQCIIYDQFQNRISSGSNSHLSG